MEKVEVKQTTATDDILEFKARVEGFKYQITVNNDYYQYLTKGKVEPETLIKESLHFLLDREPPSSILSSFDLKIITQYFSDYEEVITKKLQAKTEQ